MMDCVSQGWIGFGGAGGGAAGFVRAETPWSVTPPRRATGPSDVRITVLSDSGAASRTRSSTLVVHDGDFGAGIVQHVLQR